MYIVRPIKIEDVRVMHEFACRAAMGMHSLPKNSQALEKRIQQSIDSFHKTVHAPQNEIYVFVIENKATNEVVGTCSIHARLGDHYFYKIRTHSGESITPKELRLLEPIKVENGPTEVCGIYMKPEVRHENLSHLLSLCRFLFIASFPHRFKNTIVAQMRGVIDTDHNTAPFWEGVSRNFTTLTLPEVLKKMEHDRSFIPKILPEHPLYISLIPKFAEKVIGKVHKTTKPALKILLREGFKPTGEIDVFDGGPIVKAEISEIKAIRNCHIDTVSEITLEPVSWKKHLICNNIIDFKACMGQLRRKGNQEIMITKEVAEALNVKKGDLVRWTK